jgi:VanZ like protein/concanavalin A-like lectin/glucanase superfamily protein
MISEREVRSRSISGREQSGQGALFFGATIGNSLGAICLLVLCGMLVAGLWPFHSPKNEVGWLRDRNGVRFGKHGTIISAGALQARASLGETACSVEIWLAPNRIDSEGMILASYWPVEKITPFALRKWRGGLVLERGSRSGSVKKAKIYVGDVFKGTKPVFISITSGDGGAAAYVDGTLIKTLSSFSFSSLDLTGSLIVGNAPSTGYTWPGQFKGLAIYDRELTAGEISQHYTDWTGNRQAKLADSEGMIALYLFDEGTGNVIRSHVASAPDLVIPERFFVVNQWFLEPFWKEFRPEGGYWKDIAINVVGFIPLGFFFCLYLSFVRRIEHPFWATLILGFVVSLTIEVLQAYLPTRDSGTTDLITNTFGTALGVILCGWTTRHTWFTRVGISIDSIRQANQDCQSLDGQTLGSVRR